MTNEEKRIENLIIKSSIVTSADFQHAFLYVEKLRAENYELRDIFRNLATFYFVRSENLVVPLGKDESDTLAKIFSVTNI